MKIGTKISTGDTSEENKTFGNNTHFLSVVSLQATSRNPPYRRI